MCHQRLCRSAYQFHVVAFLSLGATAHSCYGADQELPPVEVNASSQKATIGPNVESSTASRLNLSIQDTPASIEALDSKTIRERGDYDFKDAVTRTTGLTDISTNGDGGVAYQARGFAGNLSVGVTEDGRRPLIGAGTVTLPTSNWGYERIDVLRGVGSIVSGTGTTGATINAIRKEPSKTYSVEALAALGDYGVYRTGIGGTGALGAIGSFRIDGYVEGSNGFVDRGASKNSKIMSSFRFDLADSVRLDIQADHSDQKPSRYWGTPLINGTIDSSLRTRNYNVQDSDVHYVDDRVLGRLTWKATPNLTISDEVIHFRATRHWKDSEEYNYNPATGLVDRAAEGYLEIFHKQEQTGNRIELTHNVERNRLAAGWEAGVATFRHTNNFTLGDSTFGSSVPTAGFDPGSFISTIATVPAYQTRVVNQAFYVEDAFNLSSQLLLVAGLRNENYRFSRQSLVGAGDFGSSLNGTSMRLGVTYFVLPTLSIYAQASNGSDPLGSLLSLNLTNSTYKLTTAKQYESGIKQSLAGGKAWWSAALYRISKDNIITQDPNNPALAVQGGRQSSQGLELSSRVMLGPHWSADGNFALINARFEDLTQNAVSLVGRRPANVPSKVANTWLTYRDGPWQAGTGVRFIGRRYTDDANTQNLNGYTVFDASVAYRVTKNLQIRANLRNLTDRIYATVSYDPNQVSLGAPRHAELVAEISY